MHTGDRVRVNNRCEAKACHGKEGTVKAVGGTGCWVKIDNDDEYFYLHQSLDAIPKEVAVVAKSVIINGTEYTESDVPVELAKEALLIQDACNLSGLVFSFAREMQKLCDHPRCTGTAWRNHHPIVVLWLSKLDNLCTGDLGDVGTFSKAYDLCGAVVEAQKEVT